MRVRLLSAAIFVCAVGLPAVAADDEKSTQPDQVSAAEAKETDRSQVPYQEELVVTATRRDSEAFDVPYSVETLSGYDIRSRKMSRSIPEALREVSSVLVQKTAHGQGSPFIRGFTGFHTLLMVDGIRLNHSAFRSGPNQYWATLEPLSAQRLELVKGPSSVLYGSDAVGGTVNVLTPSPLSEDPGVSWDPNVYFRYAGGEDSTVGSVAVSGTFGGRTAFMARAATKNFGDVTAGRGMGLQPYTGYEETDGDFKLEQRIGGDSKLIVAYQTVDQDAVPRTHQTIFAQSFQGTTVGSERRRDLYQDRELAYVQYHTADLGGFVEEARFSLSLHRHEETRDRLRSPGRGGDLQGFDLETVGLWAQFGSSTRAGQLTYGFEFYNDDVDSFKTRFDDLGNVTSIEIQGPVADDSSYDLFGVYVQDEVELSPNLNLTAGVRYTEAKVDVGRVDVGGVVTSFEDDWNDLIGNLRLLYEIGPRWNLFGGVSQGFRAPNLADLTKLDDTSAVEVPALGLEPEHFVSAEFGAKARHRSWYMQTAYWYTWIDDLIVQSPTGDVVGGTPVVRKDNIGDGFVQGVEFEGGFSPTNGMWLFGNFSWMDGEVDQLDESQGFIAVRAPLTRLMPLTANVGLRHQPNRLWYELMVSAVDNQDDLALRDITDTSRIPPGGTPGYTIYTVRGGYRLRDAIDISAAVENISDKNYRVHGSGQNETGTNFIVAVNATF